MITLSGERYRSFVEWLNQHYPTDKDVQLICLVGYPVVMVPDLDESGEGNTGFAAYMAMDGKHVIWVADSEALREALGEELDPDEDLIRIAHEYIHHLRYVQGGSQDEEEVEQRAREMVAEYKRSLTSTASESPRVRAWARSDDFHVDVDFDCTEYFEQASDDEILALAKHGWACCEEANRVARYFNWTHPVRELFIYLSLKPRFATGEPIGFQCYINKHLALEWLKVRRPELYRKVTEQQEHTVQG